MPNFSPKERRAHYTAVGYGNAPVKADSQFSEEDQRTYARGQADAYNYLAMGYMLGKNSPLSDAEKKELKAENKEMRKATPERREQIKAARRKRVLAKTKKAARAK